MLMVSQCLLIDIPTGISLPLYPIGRDGHRRTYLGRTPACEGISEEQLGPRASFLTAALA